MKTNRIERLEGQKGGICDGEKAVANKISDFFRKLFTTFDPSAGIDCLYSIQRKISDSMNVLLTRFKMSFSQSLHTKALALIV